MSSLASPTLLRRLFLRSLHSFAAIPVSLAFASLADLAKWGDGATYLP
jgi:hypothetical protein